MLRDKDLPAGEIASAFDMARPSVSHHLGILEEAGLVTSERKGQNIVYSLNMSVLQEVISAISDLWDARHDRRKAYEDGSH